MVGNGHAQKADAQVTETKENHGHGNGRGQLHKAQGHTADDNRNPAQNNNRLGRHPVIHGLGHRGATD